MEERERATITVTHTHSRCRRVVEQCTVPSREEGKWDKGREEKNGLGDGKRREGSGELRASAYV